MRRKPYSFVRANRRRWKLTQRELALLLGLATGGAVSRIERSSRTPKTATLVACGVVFGLSAAELFPSLHEQIEEAVLGAAKALHDGLEGKNDEESERKRALLEGILARAISRNRPKKV